MLPANNKKTGPIAYKLYPQQFWLIEQNSLTKSNKRFSVPVNIYIKRP